MADKVETEHFQVAVSLRESYKVGIGGTTREGERVLYYYAVRDPERGIMVQALNAQSVPSGQKTPVTDTEFLEKYKLEPLIYYNQVKPRLEEMEAQLDKAEKHLEAGRQDKAEKCFRKALQFDADNMRAIFGLGNAYLSAGKLDDAKEIFAKIMSVDLAFGPENKFLFNEFGIRMRKSGLLEMAKAYYEKALAVSEADENLLFNLGRVYYELGDYAAAADAAGRSLAINPAFAIAAKLRKAAERAAASGPPAGDASGQAT